MPTHEHTQHNFDLVVLGSGAGGLTAAATAARRGLKVLVVEKAEHFGGTSAISGGAVWLYGTDQARAAGAVDSPEAIRTYLRQVIGDGYAPALVDAFIEHGHQALRWLEQNTELRYALRPHSPDYYPDAPGATQFGRALEMVEYDGRQLGSHFKDLQMPPPGMLLFGGMMVNRVDIQHFLSIRRSPRSLWHCLKLMARYARDRLHHPRGTRLTTGNALIARLASSAFAHGTQLWLRSEALELIVERGVVTGVVVQREGRRERVLARGGVVCAMGGFAAGALADSYRPARQAPHLTMSPPTNDGAALRLGQAVAAAQGEGLVANFFWAPVSELRHASGERERFPHLVTDRAKPGVIAVGPDGRRFVNESDSYHHFVQTMFAKGIASCWLVCDAEAMNRYGLGLARPKPVDNQALIHAGYLHRAATAQALAKTIGVDPQVFMQTLEQFNADARNGIDRAFGKGGNSYNRYMGDPQHTPNPCLAPLTSGPFYAIRIHTGDLGSARGLVTNAQANVLNRDGQPIAGLYAVGNDMNSLMKGTYPGPGITLGPALTFGWLAANHIAARLQAPTTQMETPACTTN
ncbi:MULTISPECIES: FAD-dependent oxidoreductase [Pseudomonas]|uniref:3-oxosteroid 1-dehydrogenase n=2 Tax=Pseudomonas TaxID=286 RepID=A0ABX4U247_PSEDL|nr:MULTISPECIES: FAD-dependent oxidoreductase [Pseudomonas]MDM9556197.1 FAD-dependent oxidoreductase [Pseudomonas asiatica]PLU85584.1 3-oxosteroid 1-dehydrogenase [Pseudomonas plecoglossicida]PLU91975.1 3-oxosteroid 1-dehydrogenase [Pseudomonas plecoglossicida]PLV00950.1 3-oxosteroid 1-dehydrogenase [Pseudomonas plecoglossicida]PLV12547.1 3-oxosteroid 1-dehydrogenase [Pseudomonas plecoglossicida]